VDFKNGAPNEGVTLLYSLGDSIYCSEQRSVQINLKCAPDVKPGKIVSVTEDSLCVYAIDMESAFACPLA